MSNRSNMRPLCGWLIGVLLVPALYGQPASPRTLGSAVDRLLDAEPFANAWWGVMVQEARTGTVLYTRNADKSFVPASNTKLYTTAAALDHLGATFEYHTELYAFGPVAEGILEGDLVVRGSGDPAIGGRFNGGNRTAIFEAWADSLRAQGITHIRGDIVGDDNLFDDQALGGGWSWDDEPFYYAAEISALSFNDNCIDVRISAQYPGAPGLVSWEPYNTDYVDILNSTVTVSRDSSLQEGYERARGQNRLRLYSQVPAGRTDEESLSISNPTLFFVHVFREALLRNGIAVEGRVLDLDDLPAPPDYALAHRIATHTSVPLARIVEAINKQSQNLYAEQVLKTLSAHYPDVPGDSPPGSALHGITVAQRTYVRADIDTSRIQLVDGSGLSRMNLITPRMTTHLLRYMGQHPDAAVQEAFVTSLPIGGVDGTLRGRFASGPARGNVRAKTGTLGNVSALSGYVTTAAGTQLVFSILCNHYTTLSREVRQAQDALVTLLAAYPH